MKTKQEILLVGKFKLALKNKKVKKWIIITLVVIFLLISFDMRLKTVYYKLDSEKINSPVTIALITDLHSDWYGKNQKTLVEAIDEAKPDIVLLGGDIFDDEKSYKNTETFLREIAVKYDCYYVTGNHEYWGKDIDNILSIVESYGITILSGDCEVVLINGQVINICGVDDVDVDTYVSGSKSTETQIKELGEKVNFNNYTILLSHRPEIIDTYKKYDFDLVLCGHAHGGQWRIPGILNGLYSPHQGIFPDYAGGRYDYASGTMIVSRGLARESTPAPRIFNRPELVIIELE
ncbi:MAG: metallophosphoesterase [Lachnospiraceae bacterium]|nr:metallophosphoesterase [Lachnospiraceae bacterium]